MMDNGKSSWARNFHEPPFLLTGLRYAHVFQSPLKLPTFIYSCLLGLTKYTYSAFHSLLRLQSVSVISDFALVFSPLSLFAPLCPTLSSSSIWPPVSCRCAAGIEWFIFVFLFFSCPLGDAAAAGPSKTIMAELYTDVRWWWWKGHVTNGPLPFGRNAFLSQAHPG